MAKKSVAILGTLLMVVAGGVGAWFLLQAEAAEPVEPVAEASEPEWLTDMEKAQELAAKEDKDLLINFTGSDWCGWCIRLREEVFSKEEFDKAHEDFVFVEMDFPSDQSLVPPETRKQNEAWQQKFSVEGFPTIVLTDPKGRPYGSVGYVPGGPEKFLAELEQTQKQREIRDERFAKAKKAAGLEKAKLLASALKAVPENMQLPMYRSEIDQIIALDNQNEAGLKVEYVKVVQSSEAKQRIAELQEELQLAFGKGGATAALELVRKELKAEKTLANPVLKEQLANFELQLMLKKAEELITDDKLAEAKTIFESALKRTEKGTNPWLTVQFTRAELLQQAEQFKQAAAIYDEMLAVEGLVPPQKAMLLIYAAEAHNDAKQDKETAERVAKADKILASLADDATISPQFKAQMAERLDALRPEEKKDEKAKAEEAEEKTPAVKE